MSIPKRDIYEITPDNTIIHWVMFRGTIRKLCLQNDIAVLLENASDKENTVRFALLSNLENFKQSLDIINKYIYTKIPDANIKQVLSQVPNPVLSKLQVNQEERYTL